MSQNAPFFNQQNSPVAKSPWLCALLTILICHVLIDFYAAVLVPVLVILEEQYHLSANHAAWLLGMGSVASGITQPLAALLGDRHQTRILGTLGLLLAAIGIGSIGWVRSPMELWTVYMAGMVGVGIFHPAAASAVGQLWYHHRSAAVGIFFVAGMSGGVVASVLVPRIADRTGSLSFLLWIVLPGIALAVMFQTVITKLHHGPQPSVSPPPSGNTTRNHWMVVVLVYLGTFIRFTAQLALVYLFVRWVQGNLELQHNDWSEEEISSRSAPIIGTLIAFNMAGSALGGLGVGIFVRPGREKWPLVLVPILLAPLAVIFPHVPLVYGNALCFLMGISSMSLIPVGVALAQRMLPRRTHLASGIMIGGAWLPAMCGPQLAEWGLQFYGDKVTFLLVAITISFSGILAIPLRSSVLQYDGNQSTSEH